MLYTPYILRGIIKDPNINKATPILKDNNYRSGIKARLKGAINI
jgi:hypothetical protein